MSGCCLWVLRCGKQFLSYNIQILLNLLNLFLDVFHSEYSFFVPLGQGWRGGERVDLLHASYLGLNLGLGLQLHLGLGLALGLDMTLRLSRCWNCFA